MPYGGDSGTQVGASVGHGVAGKISRCSEAEIWDRQPYPELDSRSVLFHPQQGAQC